MSTTTSTTPRASWPSACRAQRWASTARRSSIPRQVDPCNEAFAPSADEIEYSRRVIEAFEAGVAEGKGVVTVDGKMIENLHVDNARRALAVADAIAALGG